MLKIGANLKRIRQEHKLTQRDIGTVLGIDRSAYTFYETNNTNPSLETIAKLADIYDVTVGYLLGVEENHPELKKRSEELAVAESNPSPLAYLKKDEQLLLMSYRILSDEQKAKAIELIRTGLVEK